MNKLNVYLTGGENNNWALDSDLRQTRAALKPWVNLTSLGECDVVHSMWWAGLEHIPESQLIGKRVLSHVPGEPLRYFQSPAYQKMASRVSLWIAQSTQAQQQLDSLELKNVLIPYTIDGSVFFPLGQENHEIEKIRTRWKIPANRYLIGNFHRDSEGDDLSQPKLVKGPDLFLEIVKDCIRQALPVHVILSGPRRHWLRKELAAYDIPFTFIGNPTDGDDMNENILPSSLLNILYNLIDVYVISSRSEGGPRSMMEAAAARCKIISTPVGLASDVLDRKSVYYSAPEAVEILKKDVATGWLSKTVDDQFDRVITHHQPAAVTPLFKSLYEDIPSLAPYSAIEKLSKDNHKVELIYGQMKNRITPAMSVGAWPRRAWRNYVRPGIKAAQTRWKTIQFKLKKDHQQLTVCLWHDFKPPPYGGGNQFMIVMRKGLLARGVNVVENQLDPDIDVYLLNSIHFDIDAFLAFKKNHNIRVVHRIDGPIHLIRGYDLEKDELCYQFNDSFASASIIQSNWTLQRIVEFGYQPVKPIVVNNAVDPDIFYRKSQRPIDPQRKIKLISSSWSDNPRKGGPVYKWIEENLNWDRFEYTFVGRASESFDRINQIHPVPSEELAEILREHDIYITASQRDPCSNALVEALSCGLPALYYQDGGHPELVQYGGLPFVEHESILPQLDLLAQNISMFQRLITTAKLYQVVEKYLTLMKQVAK